ncbi:cupin domain-containing protein [Baekduia soli]|nr:cupin domain-containing protein [Baekduia soli]
MDGYALRRTEELASIHGGAVKLAAAELGVESFGLQVLDFPAGFDGYPEHDHAADGQEEVYAVLGGSAKFTVDGERVPVGPGDLLRVGPRSRRRLDPGPDGVRILAIGCAPSGAYERPEGFRLAAGA